jgi:hypothetical protein
VWLALCCAHELRQFILAWLRKLEKLSWTVRMFFLTPHTQYAVC